MKLLFHKLELYGKWFQNNEIDLNFTDKVPPDTGHEWNEELQEWVLKPIEEVEFEEIEEFEVIEQDDSILRKDYNIEENNLNLDLTE